MFNIGDLVRHKHRDNDWDIGLIIDYSFYVHNNKYHYVVQWNDTEICWYTPNELEALVILIS